MFGKSDFLALVLAGLWVASCSRTAGSAESADPSLAPLAEIDGHPILRSDLEPDLSRALSALSNEKPSDRKHLERKLVEAEIDRRLILRQARKMGLEVSKEAMDRQWKNFVARFGSPAAFEDYLERNGLSAASQRSRVELELYRERVVSQITSTASVSDKAVRAYYDKNKERFARPRQFRLRHLLLRVPADASEKEVERRRAEAVNYRTQVTGRKTTLAELARRFGEDDSRHQDGVLGWVAPHQLAGADAQLESLEVGAVAVVRSRVGFHVVEKLAERGGQPFDFDQVQTSIRAQLGADKEKAALAAARKAWRKDAGVKVFVEAPPAPPPQRDRLAPPASVPASSKPPKAPGPRTGPPKM